MRYEVRHVTEYRYDEPVRESIMELRMQPRHTAGQGLVSFEVEIAPYAQVLSYIDAFGNAVHHFGMPHAHDTLDIFVRSVVETYGQPPPQAAPADDWNALASDAVRGEWWDFLNPHGFATVTPTLLDFIAVRDIDSFRRLDPLSALTALSRELYEAFEYEAGVTEPDSPIDHALLEGRGVCQDFAHIMIAVCRLWGVPARYVSGYLFTNQETHDRSTPNATHAWMEAYLPSHGWIGFDPTNHLIAGERHLSVAIGRDYADVPPSHGVFKGESESRLSVGVSVHRGGDIASEAPRMGAPALIATRRRPGGLSLLAQHQQQQQQ